MKFVLEENLWERGCNSAQIIYELFIIFQVENTNGQ